MQILKTIIWCIGPRRLRAENRYRLLGRLLPARRSPVVDAHLCTFVRRNSFVQRSRTNVLERSQERGQRFLEKEH